VPPVDALYSTAFVPLGSDDEPALGSLGNVDQETWAHGDRRELEEQCDDEGIHD